MSNAAELCGVALITLEFMHAKVKIGNGVAKICRFSSAVMENNIHSLRDAKKNRASSEMNSMRQQSWTQWTQHG